MNLGQALELLDLKPGATEADVRKAYRDIAMVWHPDKAIQRAQGLPEAERAKVYFEAEEKTKALNAAYELAMTDAHTRTPKGRCARCKGKRKIKVGSGLVTMTIACPDCSTVK